MTDPESAQHRHAPVTLRPATVADAEAVAAIYVSSWNAGFGHLLGDREPSGDDVDRWRNDLASTTTAWTVAESAGVIAGFIGVGPSRDPVDVELGEIDTIAVSPSMWRRGIGRALMTRGIEQVRARWPRAILWTPDGYERGHAFYRAMGWHRLGSTRASGTQVAFGWMTAPRSSGPPAVGGVDPPTAASPLAASSAIERDGFVVLPAWLTADELAAAAAELPELFPTADEFHDDADPGRNARFRDEFGGITNFPFASVELSLLSVHPKLVALAEAILATSDLRVYSIEAWAKYTGAADYDQALHRDYLNHTLLVPSADQLPAQVEMFLYLDDVPPGLGPPSYVARDHVGPMPALPNWYPRSDGQTDPDRPGWVSSTGRPDLYEHEVSASGPAGTVVAYHLETFHRGTSLTEARGARYTIHVNYRRADADWIARRSWTDTANTAAWGRFVPRATPRQLELFGFPPVGHRYWTDQTLDDLGQRYPGLDVEPWRDGSGDST
ncbi:MAG: GNAT family N-acetyltransferase [Actinomycetota bacterium]